MDADVFQGNLQQDVNIALTTILNIVHEDLNSVNEVNSFFAYHFDDDEIHSIMFTENSFWSS